MTAKELAEKLDGMEYGLIIPEAIKTQAKLDGLVIVYGASDDLMEFRGAIDDEVDVYEGGTVYFDGKGLLKFHDDCGGEREFCPYYAAAKKNAKKITAVWCPKDTDFSWMYETDIPHAIFRVLEDGEHYCLGIVFSMEDLKSQPDAIPTEWLIDKAAQAERDLYYCKGDAKKNADIMAAVRVVMGLWQKEGKDARSDGHGK